MARPRDRSSFITILRLLAKILPGDYLKTAFYLNVIAKPRKAVRLMLSTFYRMDHIYEVLKEFKNTYNGNFSILEFGTAQGYSFTKMLYATKYLQMDHRVVVHAFDSFEGLAASDDPAEQRRWSEGAFKGDYEVLEAYCRSVIVITRSTKDTLRGHADRKRTGRTRNSTAYPDLDRL